MKDLKTIASYILVGVLVISLFLNIRSCTKIDDTKYEQLHKDNEKLQRMRDSLINLNSQLKLDYDKIQLDIDKRNKIIDKLNGDLKSAEQRVSEAKDKADRLAKEKRDADKKIDDLQKNPIRRNDDDLLNSLKNKLKP